MRHADLPWLPQPPADFGSRCRELARAEGPVGAAIQSLATHALSSLQSASLSRAIARCRSKADLTPLAAFKLAFVSNATTDTLSDCMPAAAARHGIALDLVVPAYDQVMQQALDPASLVNGARPDAVLLALDHRWLQIDRPALAGDAETQIAAAMDRLQTTVDAYRSNSGAAVILQTLARPPLGLFGSYDQRVAGSVSAMISEANRRIIAMAARAGNYLLDVDAIASAAGTQEWFDPVQWASFKLPFSARCASLYADHVGRLVAAIRGKSRKCLVLDLDNTCWGGVIGDDGLEGIKIGQGSPVGEAFLSVQQLAKDLRGRGIMLAVVSKNDDEVARRPFREHPDMLLGEADIAVFQANWIDKASNLEAIAAELNIGIDALVMLDDNPAERAELRAALPAVAVPELPSDPNWYAPCLAAAGYFEAVSFSNDDLIRVDSYAANARRADVLARSRDLGDYLSSLEMRASFGPFDTVGRQRIAQLVNKTNQFNLTTRRYTEAEIAAFQDDSHVHTTQVRLADRFGDLGMIGVTICRPLQEEGNAGWEIDTWLMSCRVLGRRVEEAMLRHIADAAAGVGITRLFGTYRPTGKNGMVRDHYDKLDFHLIREDADGVRSYEFDLGRYRRPELPFTIAAEAAPGNIEQTASGGRALATRPTSNV